MFAPLVHIPAVQFQADAQVTLRTGNVDVANDQGFGIEIEGDFRLVWSHAAIGRVVCVLQKAGLARKELGWPESQERLKTASVEWTNFV